MKIKYREISPEMKKIAMPKDAGVETFDGRSSVNTSISVVEHYSVEIEKLIPYKNQARKFFSEEDIEGLAESIKHHGIRQPLSIIKSSTVDGVYEVVSGERRLRAAKKAGLSKVPCILLSSEENAEEIALIENLHREDLSPLEIGEAFANLLEERKDMNQTILAKKLGLDRRYVHEKLQLASLPEEVKLDIKEKNITSRDLLRKILYTYNSTETKSEANIRDNLIKNKMKSVLRIQMLNEQFIVQGRTIKHLSQEERQNLKRVLEGICVQLG